jgi:hypothetical protein
MNVTAEARTGALLREVIGALRATRLFAGLVSDADAEAVAQSLEAKMGINMPGLADIA